MGSYYLQISFTMKPAHKLTLQRIKVINLNIYPGCTKLCGLKIDRFYRIRVCPLWLTVRKFISTHP